MLQVSDLEDLRALRPDQNLLIVWAHIQAAYRFAGGALDALS